MSWKGNINVSGQAVSGYLQSAYSGGLFGVPLLVRAGTGIERAGITSRCTFVRSFGVWHASFLKLEGKAIVAAMVGMSRGCWDFEGRWTVDRS